MVTLSPAEYWELRARLLAVDAAEADLLRAQIAGRTAIAAARSKVAAMFDRIAPTYGLDPAANYTFNDDACTLTPAGPQ